MEPPIRKSSTTQRPTIEDVLRPPKQIIVDLGNATLPRSRGKNANQIERPPLSNFVRSDEQQPQQFIRWRSFNTGEKNKNFSKTSVGVMGLRPRGLDKLLAQEEREKEKVLKANNNSQNGRINQTTPVKTGDQGEGKTGGIFRAQAPIAGKETDFKNMDTLLSKKEREHEKALEPHNGKNEEPPRNEGIFKAMPVKVQDQEVEKEGGIFQARPAIAVEENNNNNNATANNDIEQPTNQPEEEIQKAINILLGAAKDHQGKVPKQSAANASIVADYATNNTPLQLNLSSPGSVIVISIANTANMGNSMATPSEADVVPQRRGKTSVSKTLTPFQRELEQELKAIRKKSLENN